MPLTLNLPPRTPIEPVNEVLHSATVVDSHRRLEDLKTWRRAYCDMRNLNENPLLFRGWGRTTACCRSSESDGEELPRRCKLGARIAGLEMNLFIVSNAFVYALKGL